MLVFAGCESVGNVFNPIVGSWESSVLGVDRVIEYRGNGDYNQTDSILGVGTTTNGTWTSNKTTIATTSDTNTEVHSYSFNSDKSQMTLSQNGLSRTYDRQ
ncbi:MAG: hypothetical protein EA403_14950 [Spirochaetaceae bacterium]|nr:MAG: hypothetical protein EA403_14950 [Spirochaetaceae bacterium]